MVIGDDVVLVEVGVLCGDIVGVMNILIDE